MTTQLHLKRVHDLDADKVRYRLQGFRGTATVSTTTNIDWKMPEERWISGGVFIASGTHWGDKLSLQIVDKDNILGYGPDFILDEFVTDFYLVTDSEFQLKLESSYIALVPANIYIRIIYTNTSIIDPVEVAFSVVSHIPRL